MNVAIIQGRLVKDPELKYTSGGKAYAKFTLAVPRDYAKDQVDFIDVTAWEKSAETIAEYVRKGHRLLVNGNVKTNVKDDKKYVEILLRSFEFVETKESAEKISGTSNSSSPKKAGSTAGKNKAFGAANEYENDADDEMEDEDENDFPF